MQNSGLGDSISALTSLDILYEIPIFLLISWRGYGGKDAPEHLIMGEVTTRLLEDIGVPSFILLGNDVEETISKAVNVLERKKIPIAVIVRRGVIG